MNLLEKIGAVNVDSSDRLSPTDKNAVDDIMATYRKVARFYRDLYQKIIPLRQAEDALVKSNPDRYGSSAYIYNVVPEIKEEDTYETFCSIHQNVVKNIHSYFSKTYSVDLTTPHWAKLVNMTPPETKSCTLSYWDLESMSKDEKAAYLQKVEDEERKKSEYIQSAMALDLPLEPILESIFAQLGGRTFKQQSDEEIVQGCRRLFPGDNTYRPNTWTLTAGSKIIIPDFMSLEFGNQWNGKRDVTVRSSLMMKNVLRALTHYDSDGNQASIYGYWARQLFCTTYGYYTDKDYFQKHDAYPAQKISSFRFYKNEKVEITFTNHQFAVEFAEKYLGGIQNSQAS